MSMSLWDLYGLSGADSVQDLLRAKELNLAADNLTLVPEAIGQLTNLTVVWLNNNEISSLPESIGELTNLVMMYIQKNPITELPQSMTRLQKLRILQIESGGKSAVQRAPIGITALPCWTNHTKGYDMQLSISDSLKRLTLFKYDNENLTDIASLVDKWRSCDSINIAQNKISTLPQQLSTLTSLCDLNLSLNALDTFPEVVLQMTWLTSLNIAGNSLTELPEGLTTLTRLEILAIHDGSGSTKIQRAPIGITTLPCIRSSPDLAALAFTASHTAADPMPSVAAMDADALVAHLKGRPGFTDEVLLILGRCRVSGDELLLLTEQDLVSLSFGMTPFQARRLLKAIQGLHLIS
eukprot:TRINITY_DN4076_c0_g1_i2.p1 TRINITY_DN4076_c0_g1~~TRINITY_DN4076_c0_g1_i2.p1  ORF type:complete len:352 (+),score=62.55 TRINITY_DN4076_c0_g1_i2:79-1134(+)